MFKSYKYRIYPNVGQQRKIDHTFGVCRLVYNLALQTKIEAYKSNGTRLSAFDLIPQLVDLKKEYQWMREVDSHALQMSVKKVDIAFKNFFNGAGHPKFKNKTSGQSFGSSNITNNQKVNFENSTISVPKIKNIKSVISRKFEGKIKCITISRTPTKKYFASVLVEENVIIPIKQIISPQTTIGIDLGIKSYAVISNGKIFDSNSYLKNSLSRLKCLQRRASKKQKGSRNRKKSNLCVARSHEKIINRRRDYIHKITSSLIKSDSQTFVIEDLNVAGMIKNRKLSRPISDASFGEFRRQMQYKCDWYGKNLVVVGRFEPSSKTCNDCGSINETLTLSDREWICANCGTLHDRDFNAAKNIRDIGLKKYSPMGSRGEPMEQSALMGCDEVGKNIV